MGLVALIATFLVAVAPFRPAYAIFERVVYTERVALLIGLEQYERGLGNGFFRDLVFSTRDLEAVATALNEIGFDPIHVYSDVETPPWSQFEHRSLLPSNASVTENPAANDIMRTVSTIVSSTKDNSLLLVYFTGHGGSFNQEVRALATAQSERLGLSSFHQSTFVDVQSLIEKMAEIGDRNSNVDMILVVDACADDLGPGSPYSSKRNPENAPAYLYSSALGQSSYFDKDLELSVFTHHFVEAITVASQSVGGDVTYQNVRRYVIDNVPDHRNKEEKKNPDATVHQQTPLGFGVKNLFLGSSKATASYSSRNQSETEEEREAYLTGLRRALYGKEE